jgi:hypothetical protein
MPLEQLRESPAGGDGSVESAGGYPPLGTQALGLLRAVADFVADGCTTVSGEQYRQRLESCAVCTHRRGSRCSVCGCLVRWKARGRALHCPIDRW